MIEITTHINGSRTRVRTSIVKDAEQARRIIEGRRKRLARGSCTFYTMKEINAPVDTRPEDNDWDWTPGDFGREII